MARSTTVTCDICGEEGGSLDDTGTAQGIEIVRIELGVELRTGYFFRRDVCGRCFPGVKDKILAALKEIFPDG